MKKCLIIALVFTFATVNVIAQPKSNDKTLWKNAKKEAKKLEKQGWIKMGSEPLEVILYNHYVKKKSGNIQELVVSTEGRTNAKTVNQAQRWATVSAATLYAQHAKLAVRGRITQEIGGNLEGVDSPDNFLAAYEALCAKEIEGELVLSICLKREKKNGGIDCMIYYLIDEDAARQARLRALEKAKQESRYARDNAEEISDFVRKGFNIEGE